MPLRPEAFQEPLARMGPHLGFQDHQIHRARPEPPQGFGEAPRLDHLVVAVHVQGSGQDGPVEIVEHHQEDPAAPLAQADHPVAAGRFAGGLREARKEGLPGADLLRDVLARHRQVLRVVSGHVHRATSTQWGHLTLSSAPSTAYLSGTGVGDGPPIIVDQPAAPQLFHFDGSGLIASEADLPGPHTTIDMRDMHRDWSTYEIVARSQGPIPKELFGG